MNTAKLTAWVKTHKPLAYGGGAVVAVGAGLYARKHKAAGPAASAVLPGGTAGRSQVIAPATYDSTASDLYNTIQPQLEALQRQISNIGQTASTPAAALPPTPTAVPVSIQPVGPLTPVAAPAPAPAPGPISWNGNNPATNPLVSPAAPILLQPGDLLPAATGIGQRYVFSDGTGFTHG